MIAPIAVMQRYELKYLLDGPQTAFLLDRLKGHMLIDRYGRTSVASLYYDTPDYRLIRASLEKPAFKEKIRLRSYGPASAQSPVFLELKRKAGDIVYKRRIQTTVPQAGRFFRGEDPGAGQIGRELVWFRDYHAGLSPACLIICDREAYFEPDGGLRLTVDYNPRCRVDRLSLTDSMAGMPLLGPGHTILEIKVQDAMPLWLTHILDEGRIRKGSFSKYGEAYTRFILNGGGAGRLTRSAA